MTCLDASCLICLDIFMWLLWLREELKTPSVQTGFKCILLSFCSSPQFAVSWFTNVAMSSSLSPVPALIKDLPQMWVQTKSLFKTSQPVHDWRFMGKDCLKFSTSWALLHCWHLCFRYSWAAHTFLYRLFSFSCLDTLL